MVINENTNTLNKEIDVAEFLSKHRLGFTLALRVKSKYDILSYEPGEYYLVYALNGQIHYESLKAYYYSRIGGCLVEPFKKLYVYKEEDGYLLYLTEEPDYASHIDGDWFRLETKHGFKLSSIKNPNKVISEFLNNAFNFADENNATVKEKLFTTISKTLKKEMSKNLVTVLFVDKEKWTLVGKEILYVHWGIIVQNILKSGIQIPWNMSILKILIMTQNIMTTIIKEYCYVTSKKKRFWN